jgi:hypothetical protein
MESHDPLAYTRFVDRGLSFFEAQPSEIQAELIAIATWLFHNPEVAGDQKFYIKVPGRLQAQQYIRVYKDDSFVLCYHFTTEPDGIVWLTIFDAYIADS